MSAAGAKHFQDVFDYCVYCTKVNSALGYFLKQ